ncbi:MULTISPECIES: DUF4214 domain-containing protein [Thiorhodovibrio]|uniref:DUF4214 domain-containing protein n=1 Tax=Thiorhodovibrio TaxID=61593 RepID=UPI0019140438|nr:MULTISPECIES: DUF4214 domain-containing protein [Thiorhodovibrio]WPL13151.1 hypothetical protein Thiosp_02945 [Thiorhodovibrio litoralis]
MAASDYLVQVDTMFIAYMGRPASPSGLEYYAQKLDESGGNYLILVDDFYKSDEGKAYYDGLSPEDQVDQVFQNVFGREAPPDGEAYWADLVSNNVISVAEMAYTIAYNASAADTAALDAKREASTIFNDAMAEDGLSFDTPESKEAARFFLASITAIDTAEAVLSAQMASQFNAADIQGLLDSCIRLVEIGNTNPTAIQAMLADGGAGFAGALANANLSAEQVGELLVAMAEAEVATPGSFKAALADFDDDLGAFFDAIDSDTEITELVTVFNDAADTGSTAGLGRDIDEILNPTTDTGTTGGGDTTTFTVTESDGVISFNNPGAAVTATLGDGVITFTSGSDTDEASSANTNHEIQVPSGTTLTAPATVADGRDITGAGNTIITGSDGSQDVVVQTTGTNSIAGGKGQDSVMVGDGTDTIVVAAGSAAVAEVDTYTLGGTIEIGDTYTLTVGGDTFTYTVPDPAPGDASALATAIVAALDAAADDGTDPQNAEAVAVKAAATVAANSTDPGTVVLTGAADGTPLEVTVSAANLVLGTDDQTATKADTQAGQTEVTEGADDQTAVKADTTAPVTAGTDDQSATKADTQAGQTEVTVGTDDQAAVKVDTTAPVTAGTDDQEANKADTQAGQTEVTVGIDDQAAVKVDTTAPVTAGTDDQAATKADTQDPDPVWNEIDTYTLGGTIEAGDTYTLTVGGETFTYTVPDPVPANATDLATAIVNELNAAAVDGTDPQNAAAAAVKAAATVAAGPGTLVLAGAYADTPLAVTMDAGNKAAQAEVDTYTLGGTIEAGDTYTLTVGGNTFTYTVPEPVPGDASALATVSVITIIAGPISKPFEGHGMRVGSRGPLLADSGKPES